jgi:hypothetical protein
MRPATLAQTYEWIIAGKPCEETLSEFLDTFYPAATPQQRLATLLDEPPLTGDHRWNALGGAVGEYLARQYRLPAVPDWAFASCRYLDRPWHASSFADQGMREYLTFASPAEFRSRNIFIEERPLRRARSNLPHRGKAGTGRASA